MVIDSGNISTILDDKIIYFDVLACNELVLNVLCLSHFYNALIVCFHPATPAIFVSRVRKTLYIKQISDFFILVKSIATRFLAMF